MKSILAGAWPPLKPLPVFKYEAAEFRATIDFDRKRGEWVCRKTSLPSNEVQELRGGLREITLALPHGEEEMLVEGAEQQGLEFDKEANRRLQAIREWREKYENGARFFELRDFLSESQRSELDDSLRLSLTARQLQFNPRNAANVFDDLSLAGGRFAALIEFAKRNKAKQETDPQTQAEEAAPGVESAMDRDKPSLGVSSHELEPVLPDSLAPNNNVPPVRDLEAAQEAAEEAPEHCIGAEEFPALSIKDVSPEPDQAPLPERMAHAASQQFEIDNSEILDEDSDLDSPPPVEHPHQEGRRFPAFTGFAAQVPTAQSSADRIDGSSSRFPAFHISAFQVNVFAILFLFAVTAFTVGLTVGRGPVGKRLREPPQSLLATDAKPPAPLDQTDESASRTPPSLAARSDNSAGANKHDNATPSEEKPKESAPGPESAEVRPTNSDSSPAAESELSARPEVNPERSAAIKPTLRNVSPRANSTLAHSRKPPRTIGSAPRSPAPYRLTSTIGAAPRLPRPSTVLVTVPGRGSQPFRVSFPNKTIAATSSLAMTSQLSVLVSAEPGAALAHEQARLEAGDLVSFVWPRYPIPGGRYGLAETIRVRATIGQLGQVLDVKFLTGSASLLPATTEAIRQWRYRPTLLDKRPVLAQQDVTIEFRPPQYSSQLSTQHPPHN